jgi:hypothetical protein
MLVYNKQFIIQYARYEHKSLKCFFNTFHCLEYFQLAQRDFNNSQISQQGTTEPFLFTSILV